ncbi:MBL fold metallo-hydrolase [Luteitalea sp. TBR-22]|uniref:MBL fold metallo-hydrolase n=1 Tax=Luteitalea sp. TBR-22 TaxID=2802971 RepID=UPI001EF7344E|nr:MBL fold metallo-hydrolase [Luteitalea sp. TBR-22]BCS31309.2 MBL fold metallo-hydrolase [Luteitalea sp. TBR-22]
MLFRQIADPELSQYAYLVGCQRTGEALLIDPERDIDRYDRLAADEGFRITTVAETHIHADYVSGLREFAERPGVRVVLSKAGPPEWQYAWVGQGRAEYLLVGDGDRFSIGHIDIEVRHTPGHTPEHVVFVVTDRGSGADRPIGVATGDFLFVGDVGRPDLLESAAGHVGAMRPSAVQLQASLRQVDAWPEFMQVWPGHGAGSACGKALGAVPMSTVGYERRFNGVLSLARDQGDAFVDAILDGQPAPPPYFARMKQVNRDGAPLIGAVPSPPRLAIADVAGRPELVVLDTREDRAAFMEAHLPGSLHAPRTRQFTAATGAYVDPGQSMVLLAEESDVDRLVRQLLRIGLDRIEGWIAPAELDRWRADGGATSSIERISFSQAPQPGQDGTWIDVRSAAEFAADHVPGALHVPQSRLAVEQARVPRGRPVIVHCATGGRAALASAFLARLGHDVRYVDDDFARWRAQARQEKVGTT